MELIGVTYQGPEIDNYVLLEALPQSIRSVLETVNGFVQFQGGLHFRGICSEPAWHSLGRAWSGDHALHSKYELVDPADVPFAQDCVGDQFILRNNEVLHLYAETGDMELFAKSLGSFLESANTNPTEYLGLEPLLQLHREGTFLEPGQLISAYPPFCTKEASEGVSLRAISADELLDFHAELASNLPPDGGFFRIDTTD